MQASDYVTQEQLWDAIREFGSEIPFSSTVQVRIEVPPETAALLWVAMIPLVLLIILALLVFIRR